uniref:KilA-N domain-containing protein n=1 Tax=viral metagenome TaxID=1070528 RepID=A0A6C0DA98_9ZZZZ
MEYICKICKKNYKTYQTLWKHNKKFHPIKIPEIIVPSTSNKIYECKYCNKQYNILQSKWKHEQICKLQNENNYNCRCCNKDFKLRQYRWRHEKKCRIKLDNILENKIEEKNLPINNHLIDIIVDKSKVIEELKIKNSELEVNINKQIGEKNIVNNLTLNNVTIFYRTEDNYINAKQLCKAGNKKFKNWFNLDLTKQLIIDAAEDTGIEKNKLIDINLFKEKWIHPDLAIQLAQWISPNFSLQISKWIRTLFTNNNIFFDDKLLHHQKEIKYKNEKIKLLEDAFIKKQKRQNFPEKNVIYMITTEDNKNKRIYIIGKANNLKNRLSTYNKTAEHEVVYYKECTDEEKMNIIELSILYKLNMYREKANRDRFVLPIEKDISLFINIIDSCLNFFNID